MDLKGILSISGEPGLYKMVSQSRTGLIVEQLDTLKRRPATLSSKISALGDIAMFTLDQDVPLVEVFKAIHKLEDGGPCLSHKSDAKLIKDYFGRVLPNYDPERVYVSDMKRVFQWYNLLQAKGLIDQEDPKAEPAEADVQEQDAQD